MSTNKVNTMNSKSSIHNQPNGTNDNSSPPKKIQKTLLSLGFSKKKAYTVVNDDTEDNSSDDDMMDFRREEDYDEVHNEGIGDGFDDDDDDKEEEASDLNEECNNNDNGRVIAIDESLKKKDIDYLDSLIKVKEEQLNELKKKLSDLSIDVKGPDITPATLLSILVTRYSIATLHPEKKSLPCLIRRKLKKKGYFKCG